MFRPESFDSYIGQTKVKELLKTIVQNSVDTHSVIPHIMLVGSAGLGKTTLAKVIAKASGRNFAEICGTDIDEQFFRSMALSTNTVLFIDEIHSTPKKFVEKMYSFLEDGTITLQTKERDIVIPVPTITVIGATTDVGLLTKSFRDRFPLTVALADYTADDIRKLIETHPACKGNIITVDAREEIAMRSRLIPRVAISAISGLLAMYPGQQVSVAKALVYFGGVGIDKEGLVALDYKLLHLLRDKFPGRAAGLQTIASLLLENEMTIRAEEQFLMKKGLIELTQQGRIITEAGIKYIAN